MEKDRRNFLIIIGLVGIIIVLFIFVLAHIIKKNSQCIENPLVYAAQNYINVNSKTSTEKPLFSCQVDSVYFYFDDEGIYESNPRALNYLPSLT